MIQEQIEQQQRISELEQELNEKDELLREAIEKLKSKATDLMMETITDSGLHYIKMDCLKLAEGNLRMAQEFFDWVLKSQCTAP
ncbi:hypothetical protein [Flavobacterium covae]|uniref:hypothetical protein n=1 Tax=Flavobacterium covae TaxID=2906076 RepID=UPI000745EAAC|nr:hypothetical protein [Flavobacterium covae]AMA49440.1 hypothetical protein AWN65_08205 [Flavobacterium covae]MCJ1808953.1 hypothetical protein [Flavobacterium covae]